MIARSAENALVGNGTATAAEERAADIVDFNIGAIWYTVLQN